MRRLFLLLLLSVGCNVPMPMRCHGRMETFVNINPPGDNGFNLQWYCPLNYHLVSDPMPSRDPHYTEWTLVCECNQ